jgi:hypothetical protein
LFPPLGGHAALAVVALEGASLLDRYVRKRRNMFTDFLNDETDDLYTQLKDKFPELRYSREDLKAALA